MSRRRLARALLDRSLVERCLDGDHSAWNELYDEFHEPLVLSIQLLLGRSAKRQDLVDDIAAKVWFTVVDEEGKLLGRFDASRGCRLSTFLAGIARNEISGYFRAERRRAIREARACRHREKSVGDSHWHNLLGLSSALTEFLGTLSPREREYCEGHLLAQSRQAGADYSAANRWQLHHRVRSKLWAFLDNR
ncbi:MAG: hypothetical protein HYX69_18490 [Planctomycetia bacterium]|nr:hypothetical protein [Planctomycetia bacterium]